MLFRSGKVVDVQTDSSAQAALADNQELTETFGNLEVVPDYNTGFMNLESGAADAVAMDIVVAAYQIEQRDADFIILDYEIAAEEYGVGFAKGNEVLRDQIQKVLEEMAEDGTLAEISTKWFKDDITIIGKSKRPELMAKIEQPPFYGLRMNVELGVDRKSVV